MTYNHRKMFSQIKTSHLGGKSKQTYRIFNLACNHSQHVLHKISGNPARWSTKTTVLYEKLAVEMRRGDLILIKILNYLTSTTKVK